MPKISKPLTATQIDKAKPQEKEYTLLLNFELMKNGFLPVDIKFTDRAKYYQCFDDYHRTGTPHALAELIAGYEREELARYVAILE